MKVAYFDCFAGISGDMTLGALVDAGLSFDLLKTELDKLNVPEFKLSQRRVEKHGIAGTKVDVDAQEGHVHRHLIDVLYIINNSSISDAAKEKARKVFQKLAEAEAKVHGTSINEVHFHEVGAVDAIVDVVGVVIGLELLGIEKIYASKFRFGSGRTRGAHGAMPIPVPAVVEMTKGYPAERTDIPLELVTPTGAAILTALSSGIGEQIHLKTEITGYGAGTRDVEQVPNLLRVEIGELITDSQTDSPILLETNIDDMTPEIYGYIIDRLLEAGARDAFLTPVIMKKGRPGIQLTALTDPNKEREITDLIFSETTTLGIRRIPVQRHMLERRTDTVDTPFGPIRVKIANVNGKERVTPEYDDCARIAREKNVPILDVYKAVQSP
ncbi:MAG: nickel pincer cofactor biosynthesis protein LarC [Candidatus Latescibacteria bacterium]|jgi:pyridinium-3,5-bisthiocarboxylic acid mononucleotide nickel chelatase|nr:nickel pincer cofactor biosynthesis protein LarC [Candidatus Latescibacterota bacterium]